MTTDRHPSGDPQQPQPEELAAVDALAGLAATLVDESDAVSCVNAVVASCAHVLGADAVGILVAARDDLPVSHAEVALELLASSSHTATLLELYHRQVGQGPAVDCIVANSALTATTEQAATRWPAFAPALAAQGIGSVLAVPLRWHGSAFGALNIFRTSAVVPTGHERTAAQAFADMATIAVVHSGDIGDRDRVARDVRVALDGRVVVEQAKGVVAAQDDVDMGEAFRRLVGRAEETTVSLAQLATQAVTAAEAGHHWARSPTPPRPV